MKESRGQVATRIIPPLFGAGFYDDKLRSAGARRKYFTLHIPSPDAKAHIGQGRSSVPQKMGGDTGRVTVIADLRTGKSPRRKNEDLHINIEAREFQKGGR